MTRAPAAAACAPVSSVDPSSTTRISSQGAAAARSRTTTPMDAASLNAGMTIDVRAAFEASAIVAGGPQHGAPSYTDPAARYTDPAASRHRVGIHHPNPL